jgi:hypothetical protein
MLVRCLTTCASAAGPRAGPRTDLRSAARSGRAVAERELTLTPARRLHARVRHRRGDPKRLRRGTGKLHVHSDAIPLLAFTVIREEVYVSALHNNARRGGRHSCLPHFHSQTPRERGGGCAYPFAVATLGVSRRLSAIEHIPRSTILLEDGNAYGGSSHARSVSATHDAINDSRRRADIAEERLTTSRECESKCS